MIAALSTFYVCGMLAVLFIDLSWKKKKDDE